MLNLYVLLTAAAGQILVGGRRHTVQAEGVHLLLTSEDQPVCPSTSAIFYAFSSTELQTIYREVHHLLPSNTFTTSMLHTLHSVEAEPALLSAMRRLGRINPVAMLHFVLMYCLTTDGGVSAALLQQAISGDRDMFEFIHRHRLKAWPVQRYADELGLSLRKFNQVFKEKFGMSAKHWLLEQRLEHACCLLQTTAKKVIDVAFESGFSNHAHFSDSFRRYFQQSPSEVRKGQLMRRSGSRFPTVERPCHES